MALLVIGAEKKVLERDIIKFSENPTYFGIGFKVGSEEWKVFKENDYLFLDDKRYKITQHIDVGDYTWFLFTKK